MTMYRVNRVAPPAASMPKKPQWIKTKTMGETGVPAKGGTQRKEGSAKSQLDKLAARYGR